MTALRNGMRWTILALAGWLVGCATLPPVEEGEGRLATSVDHFSIEGKVAWFHPQGRGNANLTWRQEAEHFRLLLTGPLGQGSVRLEQDDTGFQLDGPDGSRRAADADVLLAEVLGFSVPVAQARWWVLGVAAPTDANGAARILDRDEHGRPTSLQQAGWRISWSDRRLVEGYALPRRISLEQGETRLQVVVGAWRLPGSEDGTMGAAAQAGTAAVAAE